MHNVKHWCAKTRKCGWGDAYFRINFAERTTETFKPLSRMVDLKSILNDVESVYCCQGVSYSVS